VMGNYINENGVVRKSENFQEYLEWFSRVEPEGMPPTPFAEGGRRVDLTTVGVLTVSTVFLGIDHGWRGVPVLFETMIRNHEGMFLDHQWRYHTVEEARAGHAKVVEAIQNNRNLEEI